MVLVHKCPSFPLVRHSRVGGNPVISRTPMDSRLRGTDLCEDLGKCQAPSLTERLADGTIVAKEI